MNHRTFAAVLTAVMMLGILSSTGVSAHAELDRSNPTADSTVQGSPEQVEIWFTQEITDASTIDVIDAGGASVTAEPAKLDLFDPERKHLTVVLKPNLPNGVYTVKWSSVSEEDGDTEPGEFSFTIEGSGTPTASPVASPGTGTPTSKVSGSLQSDPPKAEKADIDDRALAIALGAGVLAALFIYGLWRLVRPRRHPFDRNPR